MPTGKLYLGDPIFCSMGVDDFTKIVPKEMLNSYCYIHSTFLIPDSAAGEYSYPGVGPHSPEEAEQKGIYQSYYQWVPLVLFLQVSNTDSQPFCCVRLEHLFFFLPRRA